MTEQPDWIRLEDLSFDYRGRSIFSRLNFTASEGDRVLVIVGASGVGKTTLLKLLAGHVAPRAGRVVVAGETVRGPSARRPMVFQDYNLMPWKTVLDNVTFGLKCAGLAKAERRRRGLEILARFRLDGTERQYPVALSGGMRQRVGLARALAVEPECVLMDEPLSALDSEMRESLCVQISELAASGTRFVVVTHDLPDAVFLADRILVARADGSLVDHEVAGAPHGRPLSFRFTPEFQTRIQAVREVLRTLA